MGGYMVIEKRKFKLKKMEGKTVLGSLGEGGETMMWQQAEKFEASSEKKNPTVNVIK